MGPPIKEFQKRFPKDVRFVFKQFPLAIHNNAKIAAQASLAAHDQGKFWSMHDLMFSNIQQLSRADLERHADNLGLDMVKFRKALDTNAGNAMIARDMREGQRAQVRGTPSVYLNGRRYQGPRGFPVEGLEAVSRAYLGL